MEKMTIKQLATMIGSEPVSSEISDIIVSRVMTQSAYANENDAVIAVNWNNQNKTVTEALSKNVKVVFCAHHIAKNFNDNRVVSVENPLKAVETFENYCKRGCNAKIITITGTIGKTTTTGLINTVINSKYNTNSWSSKINANSYGSILRAHQTLKAEHEFWVQEVGAACPNYVESSAKALKPDIVVLTNIGTYHCDEYVSKENIFYDKSSLDRYAKDDAIVIINEDDEILKAGKYHHKLIRVSLKNENADYYADNIVQEHDGLSFRIKCDDGYFNAKISLYGKYNVYNALVAIAVGRAAGMKIDEILDVLPNYHSAGIRQNMVNIGGYSIFMDCYNAEPVSMIGAAEILSEMERKVNGKKYLICGHMDRLGENSKALHSEVGHKLSNYDIDSIVCFGGESNFIYEALLEDGYKNTYFMKTREELSNWIADNVKREDITFYKCGAFVSKLIKNIDDVYGTDYQNFQQGNEGVTNTITFRVREDNVTELEKCDCKSEKVILPTEYNGNKVMRIGKFCCSRNKNIKELVIPEGVTFIGQEAFFGCYNLEKVKLPSTLKYISRSAFNACINLRKIEFPEGMLHIEYRAFRECTSLTDVYIPKSVGYIGEEAFYKGNRKLKVKCYKNSYAEEYCKKNGIRITYSE